MILLSIILVYVASAIFNARYFQKEIVETGKLTLEDALCLLLHVFFPGWNTFIVFFILKEEINMQKVIWEKKKD